MEGKVPTLKSNQRREKQKVRTVINVMSPKLERRNTKKITIRNLLNASGESLIRRNEKQTNAKVDEHVKPQKTRDVLESYRRNLDRSNKLEDHETTSEPLSTDAWKGRTEEMQARRRREIEQDILGSSGNQYYNEKQNNHRSKIVDQKQMRTMSYIALEKEVEELRNQIFGGD